MESNCKFYLHGSCRFRNQCINSHERPSSTPDVVYPISTLGAEASIQQHVQETSTIEPTTTDNAILHLAPKSKKKKSVKKQLQQSLKKKLLIRNAKLCQTNATLEASMKVLRKQLKNQKKKNSKLIAEFNTTRLNDADYHCYICYGVFIRPSLLGCSHMFCEWCIDKCLEVSNQCPVCRDKRINYTYCLNMDNFIQKMMEQMPANVRQSFKNLKASRAKEKLKSLELRAERERLDIIRIRLNTHRPS